MKNSISAFKLIRYLVSYVFIISGFMKLTNADFANHFIHLGLPHPIQFMYIIAYTEIICGIFILFNKGVKKATIPLMLIMVGAIFLTKLPYLHSGILPFAFQARLDICMLILLIILYF